MVYEKKNSRSPTPSNTGYDKEILLALDIDSNLNNWKLPPISSTSLIYKSSFKFTSDYVVKTVEQATPVHEGLQSMNLLSEELIQRHQENTYSFILEWCKLR